MNKYDMKRPLLFGFLFLLAGFLYAQDNAALKTLGPFEKVIIAPHIQATLEEGDQEAVQIDEQLVPEEKIHIELKGKTLMIYLEGAKFTTKHHKTEENGTKQSTPIYRGKQLTVHISYKQLKELSIRGEEMINCKSPIKGERFKCLLYGEAELALKELQVQQFRAVLYGDNILTAEAGRVNTQLLKAYGESKLNLMNVRADDTKISSYGESSFDVNSTETIKVWAFGDANIRYSGSASVERQVTVGDVKINKVD